jgi:transcriptional regulator of arginine metabolism
MMASKEERQRRIQEIVLTEEIATQADLVDRLRKEGFYVTQATISRDINDLRMMRVPLGKGRHRYAIGSYEVKEDVLEELKERFEEFVRDIDRGENILVIRTAEGHASGLALLVDKLGWDEIVGTLAGEDTIMVVARTITDAEKLVETFADYLI